MITLSSALDAPYRAPLLPGTPTVMVQERCRAGWGDAASAALLAALLAALMMSLAPAAWLAHACKRDLLSLLVKDACGDDLIVD